MEYLFLDYETYSECDLKKAGVYEYARHPSTKILLFSFAVNKNLCVVFPTQTKVIETFKKKLLDPNVLVVAHNAMFERLITKYVLGVDVPAERWFCTAAQARSHGLPGSLDGACQALGLMHQKNKEGHRIMLKVSKPNGAGKRYLLSEDEMTRLAKYCMDDVKAEAELFYALPKGTKKERGFWLLDQEINLRGFHVDRKLITGALQLIENETNRLDLKMFELTGGQVNSARQRDATLKYLKTIGVDTLDLTAGSVERLLANDKIGTKARHVLEIRQAVSKSSTAKYQAFELSSRHDSRVRCTMKFYGAHTGRQAGERVQPQNLFKRSLSQKDVETGIPFIQRKDDLAIEMLYDKPMELYASAIRSCIVAKPGYVLHVGDYSTVEVRVLFWLARHEAGLKALADGRDLYLSMASDVYNTDLQLLTESYESKNDEAIKRRQLGKQAVLGAGFGVGAAKFQATCESYGIEVSSELADKAVKTYRRVHAPIPKFWIDIEKAAIKAVQNPGQVFKCGYLIWQKENDFLTCKLPIGRKLYYYKPSLFIKRSLYGEAPVLSYMGVNSVTKKFEKQSTWGGKLTENVVQAVARDLLMEAVGRLTFAGLPVVLTVHDEIISEVKGELRDLKTFLSLMSVPPNWCSDLPIKVEGWEGNRYKKG